MSLLRHVLHAAIELRRTSRDVFADANLFDDNFRRQVDPWNYGTSPIEQRRLTRQAEMLDAVRTGRLFPRALEIGCAEGMFTELLAARCSVLRAVDISQTALERARARQLWQTGVQFAQWDLRRDPIEETYDLLVVTCLLEYIQRPGALGAARDKIVGALKSGGYLLVVSTRANEVVENSWLAARFIRGATINAFMAKHPNLRVLETQATPVHAYTLFQRPEYGA